MSEEEAQKVLDELQGVRPEMLNREAKRLFEAIMKIANERDKAYQELKEKDQLIGKMASELVRRCELHTLEDTFPEIRQFIGESMRKAKKS